MHKYVYLFSEGSGKMRELLGGKGANLAEMANIGLPVPPGFTITCQTCMEYANAGNVWPEGALDTIAEYRADLEERMGKRLGDAGSAARVRSLRRPLLHARHDGHRAEPRP